MRKLVLAAMLSTAAFATAAEARDGQFYVGGDFGVMLPNTDLTFTPALGAGTTGTIEPDLGGGFDGGVFVGYDLGPVRLEAEASYRSAKIDSIDSSFGAAGGFLLLSGQQAAIGDVSALSFMGNAMVDIGNPDRLSFFVGGGAGYAQVSYSNVRRAPNIGVILDDKDWAFAWQLVAGVRQPINSQVDLTLRYRFFNTTGVELVGFGGRAVDGDFQSHSLMGGITFNF